MYYHAVQHGVWVRANNYSPQKSRLLKKCYAGSQNYYASGSRKRPVAGISETDNEPSISIKGGEFID
jgi:hypothetical protein